ncbi:hypothetical protein OQA88_12303 [Cercophora sp. LCS_1]
MVDYTRWTKESLVERVKELEDALKRRPAVPETTENAILEPTEGAGASAGAAGKKGKKKNRPDKGTKKKGGKGLDPSKYSTRYVALKLAYLGKNYNGFEYQPCGTIPSIEEELWKALVKSCLIFPEKPDEVDYGPWEYSKCGRTDKGVSAFGQVIGIRLRSNRPLPKEKKEEEARQDGDGEDVKMGEETVVDPEEGKPEWDPVADEIQYCKVLNRLLPPDIRVLAWAPTLPPNFSARFSCRERQYRYFFTQPAFPPVPTSLEGGPVTKGAMKDGWLDIDKMREAAKLFEGVHDFRNFCKIDPTKQLTTFARRIFESDIVEVKDVSTALPYLNHEQFRPQGAGSADGVHPKVYYFHVRGSAFLWHQIRCMVSVLFLVAQGLEPPSIISDLLDITKNPRKPNYNMADEVPLVLWDCIFPQLEEEVTAMDSREAIRLDEEAHDPTAEVDTNLQDAIDWDWISDPTASDNLISQLWGHWREKKMDELLANRLLDCMSSRFNLAKAIEASASKPAKRGVASQRIFDGGNNGRLMGQYVPMLKRQLQPSVEETNDKWAQSKGFANAEEMTRIKNWRTAIKEAKAAVSNTSTPP